MYSIHFHSLFSAILAGDSLPGPIITGQKVCPFSCHVHQRQTICKGDNFQINVTSYLTDDTMLTGTTIVGGSFLYASLLY